MFDIERVSDLERKYVDNGLRWSGNIRILFILL